MLLRFIRYYKPHWRLFALDMTCSLVVAVCDLFYPMIAKDIINVYVPQRNLHALLLWAGILFGIYLLKACLTYVIQYWAYGGHRYAGGYATGYVPAYAKAPLRLLRRK